jgi:Mlc titration factor MtfA (ptsG expression regulator)
MTFLFIIVIILYAIIKIRAVLVSKDAYYIFKRNSYENDLYNNTAMQHQYGIEGVDYFLYEGHNLHFSHTEIEMILNRYFVYYRNLNSQLQYVFFERLVKFMSGKNFLIYSNDPFKEMPVLISAAAVQISFGLDDFELPHYQFIQVQKAEYFAENSFRILAGNVKDNSITLAWNHLLKGYFDYEDGSNVGLHEMAHALYYQEIIVENVINDFSNHFNLLMNDGENVLQQKQCPHHLYSNYAFSNLQEFWAVSVELFFEKSIHLQTAYPAIYLHLQNILKQNPLIPQQPIIYH